MNRKDWMLLAVCAANGKGLSPVQLQKTLFLLGREMPHAVGSGFYHFSAYHYGPFDRNVYLDAEHLAGMGELAITQRSGENWNRYLATAEGCERAARLRVCSVTRSGFLSTEARGLGAKAKLPKPRSSNLRKVSGYEGE